MTHCIALSGSLPRGTIIQASDCPRLESLGDTFLPVDPNIMGRFAVAGFMERYFGEGVPLSHPGYSAVCPLSLFLVKTPKPARLYWAACIDGTDSPVGSLRLSSANTTLVNAGGLGDDGRNAVQLGTLQKSADARWIVRGNAPIAVAGDAMMSLSLHGYGNVRVVWAAVSQAE